MDNNFAVTYVGNAYCPAHGFASDVEGECAACDREDKERAVLIAADDWWVRRRPVGWDEAAHLASPAVNTSTDAEAVLAQCVADLRRARGEKGGER